MSLFATNNCSTINTCMKEDYKSGFVRSTIQQVSELTKPLQFEDMGTKLEVIQVLLKTAFATVNDLQLQIDANRRAKARTDYDDNADMRRTINKVK